MRNQFNTLHAFFQGQHIYVDTADSECVDVHYGIGGGTSATRELDIRVCLKHIYDMIALLVFSIQT